MMKALFTGATGMNAQQLVVDNTANNLANVNTTGFKRSQMEFADLIYVTQRTPGSELAQGLQVPTGLQIGSGVRAAGNSKSFTEGVLANTQNPLDVAIEGDGFFRVTLPDGEIRYTRDGTFHMDQNGQFVTTDGLLLNPKISVPQDALSVTIGVDGTVSVTTPTSTTTPTTVGKITLVRFPNPTGLSSEGANLYNETASSGAAKEVTPGQEGAGSLRQGFLEQSNVQIVTELVNLIQAQRAYEVNSRTIKVADEMLQTTNNLTG